MSNSGDGQMEEAINLSLEDILSVEGETELDALLRSAAAKAGYFSRLNVQWTYLHYGAHAEIAENTGLNELSRLLSAAWQIEYRVLGASKDDAETARDELRTEFAM